MLKNTIGETRVCTVCGRSYSWRKKWERDWRQLRYCSKRCASRRLKRTDYRLEEAFLVLLGRAGSDHAISPDDAARLVDKAGWESLRQASLNAARRLCVRGELELVQDGRIVDPDAANRFVLVRLPRARSSRQTSAAY